MIVALGIFVSAFSSMGFLSWRLNKAVEGYEDENGFCVAARHDQTKISSRITPRAGVNRSPGARALPPMLASQSPIIR